MISTVPKSFQAFAALCDCVTLDIYYIGVGGRVARTRDANFLREGGGRLEILSSVCVSVCAPGSRVRRGLRIS